MPKTKISEFDIDPANNTDINSINIAEGCAPSGINNAIRQLMSDLKEFQTGAGGDSFNGAVNGTVGATTPNTGAFTTLSASGAFSANGGATLGDASGDALTINSSAVSIPNGLNFDSNTFVIDATNNRVGVGTASPSQALSVQRTGSGDAITWASSTGKTAYAYADGSGIGIFSGASVTNTGFYANDTSNYFAVYTSSTERMRIDSSGNVGIGTASPASYRLTIENNGAQLRVRNSTTRYRSDYTVGSDGSTYINSYDDVGGVYKAMNLDGNPIKFNANGTESMRIDSSGNVGIGTSSPYDSTTRLNLARAGYCSAILQDTSVGTNGIVQVGGSRMNLGTMNSYPLAFLTNGSEVARFDTSGNLGLGVTPSAWTSGKAIEVQTLGNAIWGNGSQNIRMTQNMYYNSGYKYANTGYATYYSQNTGEHQWYTAPSGTAGNAITFTQAMTLDASGNLGLGSTSPSVTSGFVTLKVKGTAVGGIGSIVNESPDGTTWIELYSGAGSTDTPSIIYPSSKSLRFGYGTQNTSSYTEAMRLDSSGNLLVGLTSATSGGGVLQVSNGITFPATQSASSNANTLDDYEEGTWTPTIKQGITSPTYARQVGTYTKIGNVVHFQMSLWLSGGTKNSSGLQIQGLPFAAAAFNGGVGYSFAYVNSSVINSTTTNLPTAYGDEQQTYFSFYTTDGGSFTGNNLVAADFRMDITGAYRV